MRTDPARTVLWSAIEDYAPLWEVAWELHPDAPQITKSERDSARRVIRELLQRGLVSFYWLVEPDGDPVPIVAGEAEGILDDDRSWEVPMWGDRSVRIGATKEGEKAYEELSRAMEARPGKESPEPGEGASNRGPGRVKRP